MGDFNCPNINLDLLLSSSSFSVLCDLIFDLDLSQVIDVPTHSKGHTLDLVITNTPDSISDICVDGSLFHSSDHFPISLSICALLPKLNVVSSPERRFNFSKADYKGMVDFLLDWDFDCLDSLDVDVIWSHIQFLPSISLFLCVPLLISFLIFQNGSTVSFGTTSTVTEL